VLPEGIGANALARYLKQHPHLRVAAHEATVIRLRAERRIGELLEPDKEKRGGAKVLPDDICRNQAAQWQRIARLPEPLFEEALAKPEPTTAALLKRYKQWKPAATAERNGKRGRGCTVEDLAALAGRTFGTIYADPPWACGHAAVRSLHGGTLEP
jgi:hypothetical protein